jgi:protein involved in polysaccharide export with SLBB domain
MRSTVPRLLLIACATLAVAAPAGARPKPLPQDAPSAQPFQDIGYADWTDMEPEYRFFPGDQLDITVPSAPELSRSVTVQPDGRITLGLIAPVMAADRTVDELQAAISSAYAGVLLRPDVTVSVKSAMPLKVFVLGEVTTPGVYDMPGDINALQAIAQAGGFKTSAKIRQVVVIRRGPGGVAMARTVDLARGLKDPAHSDLVPLRRFDIVYVPRSGIAEAGLVVQQYFRDLTPVQFGFSYAAGAKVN